MPNAVETADTATEMLLTRLRAFCFPHGEESARAIRCVRTAETGQIRMSPEARWIPFRAEQILDATRSSFRWEARLDPGRITSITVTDAYEEAHGFLSIKLGGVVPVTKVTGAEVDLGELQRYLASIVLCPAILLNHLSLECKATGPLTLQLLDHEDKTGAAVEFDISPEGCPLACRANRPRLIGKRSVMTPWFATSWAFREWEGMRVPRQLKVSWQLPQGAFPYYVSEITSYQAVT